MKKTNNSPTKRIAASAMMLAVSAAMLGTSTYAWFTMNKEVTVTGMEMHTKVSDNLLIATDTLDSTTVVADNLFYNSLVQSESGLIEPVSTINGTSFWYTSGTNVKGNGDAVNEVYASYDKATSATVTAFQTAYDDNTAVGYIDYVYQLKAINGNVDAQIRLTGIDLTYGGASPANNQKAHRVAIFAEDLGYKTGTDAATHMTGPAGGVGTLQTIFSPSGATNFESGKAVGSATATADLSKAYNTAFTLDVGTNRTQYYKVVVRLWLEGEDTTCTNSTFMDLKDKWSLDMKWNLEADDSTENTSATALGLAYTATKTALLASDTVDQTAANTINVNGVAYYPITSKTLNGKQLYTTATSVAAGIHVFTFDTNNIYPTEVTNQVTLPTT